MDLVNPEPKTAKQMVFTEDDDFKQFLIEYVNQLLIEHYHPEDKDVYKKQLLAVDSSTSQNDYSHDYLFDRHGLSMRAAIQQVRFEFENKQNKKSIVNIFNYLLKTAWIYEYVTKASYQYELKTILTTTTENGNCIGKIKYNKTIDKGKDSYLDRKTAAMMILDFCKKMSDKNTKHQHSHYKTSDRQWSANFYDQLKGKTAELETAILLHEPIDSMDLKVYQNLYHTDNGVDIQPINQSDPYQVKSYLDVEIDKDKHQPYFSFPIEKHEFENSTENNCQWMLIDRKNMGMYFFSRETITPVVSKLFSNLKHENKIRITTDNLRSTEKAIFAKTGKKIENNYTFRSVDEVKEIIKSKTNFPRIKYNIITTYRGDKYNE